MKSLPALLSIGLVSSSLCLFAQQEVPRPTPAVVAPAESSPVPQAASQPLPPVSAPDVMPNYILGANDAIHVTVWKDQTLTGPLVVRPDGKISLPLLGDVPAAGLTPMALAGDIAQRLKQFINDPTVTVTVTAVNSKHIFFVGEVQRPGPYPLTREITMLQAISAAGGLTPYANAKKIYILRGGAAIQQKIPFDYKKALKQGNQQGVVLTAGDTIVVP